MRARILCITSSTYVSDATSTTRTANHFWSKLDISYSCLLANCFCKFFFRWSRQFQSYVNLEIMSKPCTTTLICEESIGRVFPIGWPDIKLCDSRWTFLDSFVIASFVSSSTPHLLLPTLFLLPFTSRIFVTSLKNMISFLFVTFLPKPDFTFLFGGLNG